MTEQPQPGEFQADTRAGIEPPTLLEQARLKVANHVVEHIKKRFPQPASTLKLRLEIGKLCRRYGCAEDTIIVEMTEAGSARVKVKSRFHTLALAAAIEQEEANGKK